MIWLLCLAALGAPVTIEPPPQVGLQSMVLVLDELERPEPGVTVQVVHRPGLAGERQQAIGITDSRGVVRWTPHHGGVATLRAGDRRLPMVVAWQHTPLGTWVLLVLLGVAALGFAGYGVSSRRPGNRSR